MAQSQQVIREIFVADAIATETTLPTFTASASPGEIAVVSADGTAPGVGKDFVVVLKGPDGQNIKSDLVKNQTVTRREGKAYKAEVGKEVSVGFTVPSTAGAKAEYQVRVEVYNAGSLSVQNTHTYIGHYVLNQTGSLNAEDVVDGLITNLNQNLSKDPESTATTNPYFTFAKEAGTQTFTVTTAPNTNGNATATINGQAIIVALLGADDADGAATKIAAAIDAEDDFTASATGSVVTYSATNGDPVSGTFAGGATNAVAATASVTSTSKLTITAKPQPIVLGKKFGRPIEFDVLALVSDNATSTVQTVTPPNPGMGTGKQVATLEYFYRGERGDKYRGLNYPWDWPTTTKTLANPSGTYNVIEITHSNGNDNGINKIVIPKELTIAIAESPGTTTLMDALVVDIGLFYS